MVFFAFHPGLERAAEHRDDGFARVFEYKALDDGKEEYLDFKERWQNRVGINR